MGQTFQSGKGALPLREEQIRWKVDERSDLALEIVSKAKSQTLAATVVALEPGGVNPPAISLPD